MFNVVSLIIGVVALILAVIAFIPPLGAANWRPSSAREWGWSRAAPAAATSTCSWW